MRTTWARIRQFPSEQPDHGSFLLNTPNRRTYQGSKIAPENSTRPLVFTSASGCRASENFDISSEN